MARSKKKRPQYLQRLVDRTNEQLARKREKDPHCDLMIVVEDILLKSNCYNGFNFFKYLEDGRLTLSGSPIVDKDGKELYDCVQLY